MTALQRLAVYHSILPQTAKMERIGSHWFVHGFTHDGGVTDVHVDLEWRDPNTTPEAAAGIALQVQAEKDAGNARYHYSEANHADACAAQHPGPWRLLAESHRATAQAAELRRRILIDPVEQP